MQLVMTLVVTGSDLQTASTIAGGDGNDSVSFGGDLSGGITGGSGQDTLNFSAGVNNSAVISADADRSSSSRAPFPVLPSTEIPAATACLQGCYLQQHH